MSTYSTAYTSADVRDVFNELAADLDMIARATGLDVGVDDLVQDLILLAQKRFISRVDLVLHDADGPVCANSYVESTSAGSWTNQRPGDNNWPKTPGGSLEVIVSLTGTWPGSLAELRLPIGESYTDTSYPGLIGVADRRYARNDYGLERTVYRRP